MFKIHIYILGDNSLVEVKHITSLYLIIMHEETSSSKELNKKAKEKVLQTAICISKIHDKKEQWELLTISAATLSNLSNPSSIEPKGKM